MATPNNLVPALAHKYSWRSAHANHRNSRCWRRWRHPASRCTEATSQTGTETRQRSILALKAQTNPAESGQDHEQINGLSVRYTTRYTTRQRIKPIKHPIRRPSVLPAKRQTGSPTQLMHHHRQHHRSRHSNHCLSLHQIRHTVHRDGWQWRTSMSRSGERYFAVGQD